MRSVPVATDVPTRAREAARATREASRPPASVPVEHLTPASAARAGRFEVPQRWPNHDLLLRVSPVLADHSSPEAGLLLASVPVIVCGLRKQSCPNAAAPLFASPLPVVIAWGADSTMRRMTEDDWRFAVGAARGKPVPAYVSSHLRALAYYSALPAGGVELLQRWKAAQEAVLEQVELLESVFGAADPAEALANGAAIDMSGEQVLRHRDRDLAAAWCGQARIIAASSKRAYARASRQWLAQQGGEL